MRLSDQTRQAYPDIPWTDMIGMRNRLIHAYFDTNLDIVWRTVTEELPPLIACLEQALKRSETP